MCGALDTMKLHHFNTYNQLYGLEQLYHLLYIHVIICTAEKATEILREVKGAQEAFRKQKDLQKLEAEV